MRLSSLPVFANANGIELQPLRGLIDTAPSQTSHNTVQVHVLPPGTGPVGAHAIQAVEDIVAHCMRAAAEAEHRPDLTATTRWPAPEVEALRAEWQAIPATASRLARLAVQFHLEGAAVRAALTSSTVKLLREGTLLKEAVAGKLGQDIAVLLSRNEIYATINTGAPGTVAPPYSEQELRQAGMTGSVGKLEADSITCTDDAFRQVIFHLESAPGTDPSRLADIKLAHEAFKAGVASRENALELGHATLTVQSVLANNKVPGKTTKASRRQAVNAISPELQDAKTALDEFAKGSNRVLQAEHLTDALRRTGTLAQQIGGQLAAAGGAQAAHSLVAWGLAAKMGRQAGNQVTKIVPGTLGVVASFVLHGAVAAGAHKLFGEAGPRDVVQTLCDLTGARPVQPTDVNQLYPAARECALDADGNVIRRPTGLVAAEEETLQKLRNEMLAVQQQYTYGNFRFDNTGQGSFSSVAAEADALQQAGVAGMTSLPADVIEPGIGGGMAATSVGVLQLRRRVNGLPAFACAKRPDSRTLTQKIQTSMQRLDLLEPSNRLDWSTRTGATICGLVLADAIKKNLGVPIQAMIDAAPVGGIYNAIATGVLKGSHVAAAGLEKIAMLGCFYTFPKIADEAKSVTLGAGLARRMNLGPRALDLSRRLLVGADALVHPIRRAEPYKPGMAGRKRQIVHNVVKAPVQTVTQAYATTLEVVPFLIGSLMDQATRSRDNAARAPDGLRVSPPDLEADAGLERS